jgi:hypothetical protein
MTALYTTDRHDQKVRQQVLKLVGEGYQVKARMEGWFEPPDVINGYRPDIVARKGDDWIIIEVKKGDADWPKIAALEAFQGQNPNYKLCIIDLK